MAEMRDDEKRQNHPRKSVKEGNMDGGGKEARKRSEFDRGDLYIDLNVYGGAFIPSVIRQMVELANRIGISVWAELNGVRTLARVGDDPEKIHAAWEEAGKLRRSHAASNTSQPTP
jgi:hypothetical protein